MTEGAPPAIRGLARRVALGTVLGALVLSALALHGDVRALREHLARFSWSAFAAALALSSSNYALRFVRWQAYLRNVAIAVPTGQSLLVFLAGLVMSVTPGKLGEVLKSYLLWEIQSISVARSAPIVIAERLTDLLALVILATLGALALEQGAAIAAAGGAVVGLTLLAVAFRPFGEASLRLAGRIPGLARLTPRLREAYEALRALLGPSSLLFSTGLATLGWGLECMALWRLVAGFEGASISLEAASLAYTASTIAGALAMLPGGLGVTEAGMATLLEVLGRGVDPSVATGATMLVRLATLWWAVVVGAVALAFLRAVRGSSSPTSSMP